MLEMQNFSPKSEPATSYPVQIKYRKNELIFYNIKYYATSELMKRIGLVN